MFLDRRSRWIEPTAYHEGTKHTTDLAGSEGFFVTFVTFVFVTKAAIAVR